ncbi:MAG TPA: hypothetical protein VMA73_31860 [Streptosporangiaceae bacterium]|nr:hypothetical protein [Streptosporangiaceae bacterium]
MPGTDPPDTLRPCGLGVPRARTLALLHDCRDGVRAFDNDGQEQNTKLSAGQDRLSTGNLSELFLGPDQGALVWPGLIVG